MRTMRAFVAALTCVAAAASASAAAGDAAYEVTILAIRATKSNSEVSPELRAIVPELKKQYENYTGFKIVGKASKSTDQGKTVSLDVTGGYQASATPLKRDGKRVQFKMQVTKAARGKGKDQTLLNTTVTIDAGRYQLFDIGRVEGDGADKLIIAGSVR